MSRAELIAACQAQQPHSPEWMAAVVALGRACAAGFPEAKKPGRPTGLSRGELYHRMLRSHVFDTDRKAWESKWYASATATTFDEMKQALEARKEAEKQVKTAA
jgi:hypothetical protein